MLTNINLTIDKTSGQINKSYKITYFHFSNYLFDNLILDNLSLQFVYFIHREFFQRNEIFIEN